MPDDTLKNFENAARQAFRFLNDEKGFNKPWSTGARAAKFLAYRRSGSGLQPLTVQEIQIGIDWDAPAGSGHPFISFHVVLSGGKYGIANLDEVLTDLNLDVNEFSRSGEWSVAYTRYLEERADAFRQNYNTIIDKAIDTARATACREAREPRWIGWLILLLFILGLLVVFKR